MIKNYLKTAWRSLLRHKAFSFINITGLAIGVASCLLLFTVIKYELSYDSFQPKYNQIYHVITEDKRTDGIDYTPAIPFPGLEAIRVDIPEVTAGALMASYGSQVTVLGTNPENNAAGKKFIERNEFFFADPQFFEVFQYKWLSGSPQFLKDPNVTVLTQKMGDKYFGDWKTAVGQFLRLDNTITVKVVGILEDVPANSDFPLGIVTSFETAKSSNGAFFYSKEWGAMTSNFQVFMLLPDNVKADKIANQLVAFSKKHYPVNNRTIRTNLLQPLSELHFDKRVETFGDHVTERSTLWTLSLIGIFIIIMACINFINLSTAQAVGRSKEIGIRKVLGSFRRQLFGQVIGETSFIVSASVLLAILIAWLSLPLIKHITLITEPLSIFNWQTLLFALALIILVSLLACLSGVDIVWIQACIGSQE